MAFADWVIAAIRTLGPLGVFLLMVPESACVPVPSELTMMGAGFAVSRGWMGAGAAVAAGTAGNLLGSMLVYGIGRWGRDAARRAAHAPDEDIQVGGGPMDACVGMLRRHGDRAVFLARLLPLARTFVSLPAGRAGVPIPRFVGWTIAGCAIWSGAFVALGALAGTGWQQLGGALANVLLVGGAAALLAVWLRGRRA